MRGENAAAYGYRYHTKQSETEYAYVDVLQPVLCLVVRPPPIVIDGVPMVMDESRESLEDSEDQFEGVPEEEEEFYSSIRVVKEAGKLRVRREDYLEIERAVAMAIDYMDIGEDEMDVEEDILEYMLDRGLREEYADGVLKVIERARKAMRGVG